MMAATLAVTLLTFPSVAQRGRGGGGVGIGVGGTGKVGIPPATLPNTRTQGGARADVNAGANANAKVDRLESNPALVRRIEPLLPPNTTVQSAAAGFRNQGEFLAALHVSQNLGIPFQQLKQQMTQGGGRSLGAAIQTLRPDLDKKTVKDQVKTAEKSTGEELRGGGGTKTSRADRGTADEIRANAGVSSRVSTLLPAGMTLDQASAGFRNSGQFVAALHVSKNLGIPFRELRARMISGGESLGEAIHALRPEMPVSKVDASINAAAQSARNDLQASGDVSTTALPRVRQ